MIPIFHFSYANPDNDLTHLKRERKSHHDLMIARFLRGDYQFFQNADFNQKDLDFGFQTYAQDITILHFSGHAGMGEIRLEDGQVYIDGIGRQLKKALGDKMLPKLVMAFLNGCSTVSLVSALLEAGVPIVIATATEVDDSIAADFSIRFYDRLVNGETIAKSFEAGEDLVKTYRKDITITRGIGSISNDSTRPLWGIFCSESKKHLLNWTIAVSKQIEPTEYQYEINSIIQGALYNSLLKHGSPSIKTVEAKRIQGTDIREEINSAILLAYPGPISYSIANLFKFEIDNMDQDPRVLFPAHLLNIYNVYHSISELMFIIMLSQLWEVCLSIGSATDDKNIKPILPVDYRKIKVQLEEIKDFFYKSRTDRKYFDYISKIRAIRQIFDLSQKKYFVEELEKLKNDLENDADLVATYAYFELLREDLKNQNYLHFNTEEYRSKCEDGERFLSYFLDKISFCSRYDFGILKSIELRLPRSKRIPTYIYKLLKIPKSGNTKYFVFSPNMSGFTSVKSVIMLRAENFDDGSEIQKLSGQINLSPFMLDFNVNDPRAEKGNLLVYSHYDQDSGTFCYEEAFRSGVERYIRLDESIYLEVFEIFSELLDVLFNETMIIPKKHAQPF